jgi:hypothetical protein
MLAGTPPSSCISFSISISDSSFAISSSSPSAACCALIADVEKAAAYCVLAGFHAGCSKETCRAAGLLTAELANREIARGAERVKDLIESMMEGCRRNVRWARWMMVVM